MSKPSQILRISIENYTKNRVCSSAQLRMVMREVGKWKIAVIHIGGPIVFYVYGFRDVCVKWGIIIVKLVVAEMRFREIFHFNVLVSSQLQLILNFI